MKFLIEKTELAKALGKVRGITSRPSNMKVTAGVLIKAEAGEIVISATDLETGFRGAYTAIVTAEGRFPGYSADRRCGFVRYLFDGLQTLA